MRTKPFPTPQEAEAAFYEAFENADIDAMMAVWAVEEEIVCIHPNGPRLQGYEAVRESWRQLFSSGARLRFQIADQHYFQGMLVSVHVVHEFITARGQKVPSPPTIATNIFLLAEGGWRLILHHASASSESQGAADSADSLPHVLH